MPTSDMARRLGGRDEVAVQTVYLLAVVGAPPLGGACLVGVASWLGVLHGALLYDVGPIVISLGAGVGMLSGALLNREFKRNVVDHSRSTEARHGKRVGQ